MLVQYERLGSVIVVLFISIWMMSWCQSEAWLNQHCLVLCGSKIMILCQYLVICANQSETRWQLNNVLIYVQIGLILRKIAIDNQKFFNYYEKCVWSKSPDINIQKRTVSKSFTIIMRNVLAVKVQTSWDMLDGLRDLSKVKSS